MYINNLLNELLENTHNESGIKKFNSEDLKNHLGIGVIFLSNDKKKILLMDHVKFDFFTIPIGKVKPEETIDEALHIEIEEELGVKLIKYHEVDVNVNIYIRENGPVNVEQHIFLIEKYSGVIKNLEPDKHRSIKWYTFSEALKLKISDNTKRMVEGLINGTIK